MMAESMFPSIKPAKVGDRQYHVNLLHMYLPSLQSKLDVVQVSMYLVEEGLITLDEIDTVCKKANNDNKSAVLYLMKQLIKSEDPLWFSKFKRAVKKSGQQIICELLDGEDIQDEDEYEKLLLMNFVAMCESIKPSQILPHLFEKETVTSIDMEEIMSEEWNHGNSKGALKLLTRIYCKKRGWFVDLIEALKAENYLYLLQTIHPDFIKATSDRSIMRVAETCIAANRPTASSPKQNVTKTVEKVTTSCDVTTDSKNTVSSDDKRLKSTELANSIPFKAEPIVSISEDFDHELPSGIIYLKTDDEQKESNNLSSLCDDNVKSALGPIPFSQKLKDPAKSNSSERNDTLAAERRTTSERGTEIKSMGELSLHSECPDSSVHRFAGGEMNQLSRTLSYCPDSQSLETLTSTAEAAASDDDDDDDSPVTKMMLQLRGYQLELAEKAVDGKNCIIVAPTGSGKTIVALHISKLHLDTIEEDRKVLFFVPSVALVKQQRRQYLTFMDDACRVTSVCGDKDMQMGLRDLITKNDVVVLTPQIFLNAIDEGVMDDSFSQFTLMIFDECHHTMKDHPYNKIMSKFNDVLLSGDEDKIHHLPQVIGLTASPGVGKAKTDEAAIDHILKLCANLAGSDICTVSQRKNLDELEENVNVAVEGIEDVRGRVNDPFAAEISQLMTQIENKMRNTKDIQSLAVEAPNIAKVLEPPSQRGHDSYTQFLAHMKREIAKIYSQETRRFFLSCQEHLEVYHNSLLINADCRTIEAVEYIKDHFKEMDSGPRSSLPSNEVDLWLSHLFTSKVMDLEEMSRSRDSENPKLRYLERLILGYYRKNPKSQGIIFCKTRFMTDALVKWIKETDSLKFLNPHILVGSGSRATKGNVSMTHRKLEDALKFFKDGLHKIVVATTVAEEGLDVKSCNYVIRYEHVTNDIARVQSRGRARADDAKYVVVAEREGGVLHREAANQIREELMIRAIFLVHRLPKEDFESRILLNQQNAKQEREMSVAAKLINDLKKEMRSHEGDFEMRCFKCDSMGVWCSDLRTIKGSHHVVLDPDFKDRILTEDHPRPIKYDDFEKKGKIKCKGCRFDWGISALYKSVPIYLLKVCSFVVEDQHRNRFTYKKWKEVPFQVNELMPEDMGSLVSIFDLNV